MDIKDQIKNWAEAAIQSPELFLVDVKVLGKRGNQKVIVLVDGDNGIDIDQCGQISSRLSEVLDSKNLFEQAYTLEVSSPGADEPILNTRQFKKNTGRKVAVTTAEDEEITGTIKEVGETGILIEPEKTKKKQEVQPVLINYNQIKKSNIIISFS